MLVLLIIVLLIIAAVSTHDLLLIGAIVLAGILIGIADRRNHK